MNGRGIDLSINGEDLAIRTAFPENRNLVQILRGVREGNPRMNGPVDFRLTGLQPGDHRDIWHVDQVLAFSTDECAPLVINGEDLGGNHGWPGAVIALVPCHRKTFRDAGTLWRDGRGLQWTLIRVESPNRLLFLSENVGPTKEAWAFADSITGPLTGPVGSEYPETIVIQQQSGRRQLTPAIRHLQREIFFLRYGKWQELAEDQEGCEAAKICETYEIINPATVAEALRFQRPVSGYENEPSPAVGEAAVRCAMTYRVSPDGMILCDFDHRLLQRVHMSWYMGIMHQEKCDAGGGVWRVIPGLLPFEYNGQTIDLSVPFDTSKHPLPDGMALSRDLWADPEHPPDRQLDLIRRPDGSTLAAFASGFLPVYDGEPARRSRQITDAGVLAASRKTYPTFAGGKDQIRRPERESATDTLHFDRLRGTAYRKYFLPGQDGLGGFAAAAGENPPI